MGRGRRRGGGPRGLRVGPAGDPAHPDVAHRLARHGHTRALEVDDATPEGMAGAIAGALADPVDHLPVAPGGAARAAAMIAELL